MAKFIVVIGAGISGLSLALEMRLRGRRVIIVEQSRTGSESTWAGGGILSPLMPWNYSPPVTSLALRAMQQWPDWVADIQTNSGMDAEYRRCGMRVHHEAAPEKALAWCKKHGVPAHFESQDSSLWLPHTAQIRNPKIIQAMNLAFEKSGGFIYEHTQNFRLHRDEKHLQSIEMDGESFAIEQLVITTGAWAGLPLKEIAPVPNIRPIRGQMLLFRLAPDVLDTILYSQGHYIIPRRDGHILVGSTLEDCGFDKSTPTFTAQKLHGEAMKLLPALATYKPIRHWAGLRPGSPDNIPVIGPHPDYDNVFINAGHYRYGLTMAPAAAELLADLMEGKPPALDPTPYSWAAALQRHW